MNSSIIAADVPQSLNQRYSAQRFRKDKFRAAISHQSLLSLSCVFTRKPKSRITSNYGINLTSTCEVFWHSKKKLGGTMLA